MEQEGAHERVGCVSCPDSRVVRERTGPERGRSRRSNRETDWPTPWSDAGQRIHEEPGNEVAMYAGSPTSSKKSLEEHVAVQSQFLENELMPRLEAAQAGTGHVFFVDAAHFVFGTFLCCVW